MDSRLPLLALLLLVVAGPGSAQQPPGEVSRDSLRYWADVLRRERFDIRLRSLDSIHVGGLRVAPGQRIVHDVVVAQGNLEVFGTIEGNAVAIGGDVILHPGSLVTEDAIALRGQVTANGKVNGEIRIVSALPDPPRRAERTLTPIDATKRALGVSLGSFVVLMAIGIGVLLLARPNLEAIAETIQNGFSRSFAIGLLGQLALLPGFLLLTLALAIVVIVGWLLAPFALVAYLTAAVGALALGFLAMAYVIGAALLQRRSAVTALAAGSPARFLFAGLALFLGIWLLSSALTWAGFVGDMVRVGAIALTWVAVTVGFGATLASRAGTRRDVTPEPAAPPEEEYLWQTPTPVSGVAAARRPTPAPGPRAY